MATAPGCEGKNYRCPNCGLAYTLAESWNHDRTQCETRDWHAEEGFIATEALEVGDVLSGGVTVLAPATATKSGKTLSLRVRTADGTEQTWTRISAGTSHLVPARATGTPAA